MKRTFDALSGGIASDCAKLQASQQTDEAKIIDHHLKRREWILSILSSIIQKQTIDLTEIEELNRSTTDYIIHSQFVVLPPLCNKLDDIQRERFIDNSVAFSYITNILAQQPTSRVLISTLIELFTDRFIYEDELFGRLNKKLKKFG